MKITCPSCGSTGSLELFMADAEWRSAIMEAAELPSDCGPLVIRYVGMFRAKGRSLTPDRARRLISECCKMITTGAQFDRQHLVAPSHVWRQVLLEMLDAPKVQRPLKNHNYLLRILQSTLGQQADFVQVAEAAGRRGESRSDAGLQHVGDEQPSPKDPVGDAWRAMTQRDRDALMKDAYKELETEKFPLAHQKIFAMPRAMDILRRRLGLEESDATNRS